MSKKEDSIEEVNEKLDQWYNDTIVDDIDENNLIAGVANRESIERFNIDLGDNQTVLAIYAFTLESIFEELHDMQKKAPEGAALHIDDIMEIGYDNSTDDGESEKQGNFSPYIYDLGGRMDFTRDMDQSSVDNCTRWMTMKLKDYPKLWDTIASKAMEKLHKEVEVEMSQACTVLPLFTLIQSQLCDFMDTYRKDQEKSSVMITFAGIIDVYARQLENGDTAVEFKPKPMTKLSIKSDANATAIKEDED